MNRLFKTLKSNVVKAAAPIALAAQSLITPVLADGSGATALNDENIEGVEFNTNLTFGSIVSQFGGLFLNVVAAFGAIMFLVGLVLAITAMQNDDPGTQGKAMKAAVVGFALFVIRMILALAGFLS